MVHSTSPGRSGDGPRFISAPGVEVTCSGSAKG